VIDQWEGCLFSSASKLSKRKLVKHTGIVHWQSSQARPAGNAYWDRTPAKHTGKSILGKHTGKTYWQSILANILAKYTGNVLLQNILAKGTLAFHTGKKITLEKDIGNAHKEGNHEKLVWKYPSSAVTDLMRDVPFGE